MLFLNSDQMFLLGAVGVAVAASVVDIRERRLPNALTFPGIAAGLLLHLAVYGFEGFLSSFTAMLVCGIVFLLFLLVGGVGAGDLKLMMAVGALSGLHYVSSELVLTALAGGVGAVIYALKRGHLKKLISNCFVLLGHHKNNGFKSHPVLNVDNPEMLRMPYGVFIALGAFGALLMAL